MKPEVSGRLTKWAIELGEHEINYAPRNAIKGQVLADFIAELTCGPYVDEEALPDEGLTLQK